MAVPTKTIVTQTYEGETITCAKFSCTETSDFKFSKVAPIGGNYQFQVVIRASATRTISVQIGGETKTITISSTFKRYTLSWMGVSVNSSTDLIMSFPSGDYWLYNIQLERATSPSGWRPAPEDAADDATVIAGSIAEDKAAAALEAQTQADIFNKLTNNGQVQGLYMTGGKIYLNATYIQTGTLSIKKNNVETFYANADTGVIRIKADEFSLSDGTTLSSTLSAAEDYADAAVDGQTQLSVFNKLTNNGQTQGIYLSGGKIYINASYIRTGTFSVKKNGTTTFSADASTGVVNIKADSFSLSDGTTLASTLAAAETYADTAASNAVDGQTQLSIFNKLTNNGQTQGIYLSSGKIYINASYIQTGTFTVKKNGTTTFSANASTGVVTIVADSFSLSSGTTLASTLQDAKSYSDSGDTSTLNSAKSYTDTGDTNTLNSAKSYADGAAADAVDAQTQLDIFNKLTNNGQTQGIYLSSGKVYINATYIQTGTLSANRIRGGTLQDTQGNMVWNLATGAMSAKNLSITSTNFTLTNTGSITATSGTIGGWGLQSYGLYKSDGSSWKCYIGETGHITRNIAGSGSRTDWIVVFGSYFGITNAGDLYCSSGYMNNITLKSGCNVDEVVTANYINGKVAVLGHLSIEGGGIKSDTLIYCTSTVSGNKINARTGIQTDGKDGITRSYVLKDPNGNSVISFTMTNGILTTGSDSDTYTFTCTKTFKYTKTAIRFWAYDTSTASSKTYYNPTFVSDISATSGTYTVTI